MYTLKFDRFGNRAGTTVYDLRKQDFGTASMDSMLTQIDHVSVTLDPSGDYPFFTVPLHELEPVS